VADPLKPSAEQATTSLEPGSISDTVIGAAPIQITQETMAVPVIPTGGTSPLPPSLPPEMPGDDGPMIKSSMPTLAGGDLSNVRPPSLSPNRYAIATEIARGGMGRVVEAVDTVLGRVVALKEALALDPDAIRRFQRETKITARLEHPSIVPVHDAGTMPGGAPFYVMRKIGGRPLETLVAATKTVQERLAFIPVLVAAANAVAHAHVRGIVHRDIKPSNILVGDLGETIVIDWGLAKVIGEADDIVHDIGPSAAPEDIVKTRVGIVYGTPGFMAPEQLCGFPVDERCDVYALGATLYHVLSMKPPHHAKTADAMMPSRARPSRSARSCPAYRPSSRRSSTRRSRPTRTSATRTHARSPRICSGSSPAS
jgi:serine/threonine protein kinase